MGTDYRILLVDDEPDILEFLQYNLSKEGFDVYTATNGEEGISLAKKIDPHLIILDIMMPIMDGVETCHMLRSFPEFQQTLITFLTAREEEYSEIAGLEAGADDYIQKPIRPRLLIARVKSLLRRMKNSRRVITNYQLELGELIIDKERYEVFLGEHKVEMAKKEFDIVWMMASKPGKVFSRSEIYRKIWGTEVIVGNRTIDVHISKIRDKIGGHYIKTVKGLGYKMDN